MPELVQGWDAVLAIAFARANETFVDAQSTELLPRTGQRTYSFSAGSEKTDVVVFAVVGGWRVLDARGAKVVVQIVLTHGNLSYADYDVDLSRVDFKVTVPLKSEELNVDGDRSYTLTLDFADKDTVAVPNMTKIAAQVPKSDLIGLNAVLTDFFFDAISGGEVDLVRLDAGLLDGNHKWLAPKVVSCSSVTQSPGVGALSLLLSTINTPPRGLTVLPQDLVPGDGGSSLTISNEILTKKYAAPAFARQLRISPKKLNMRPGRLWTVEIAGPLTMENAVINKAKATVKKGELQIVVSGVSKFWGGAALEFEITAGYEVVVGGKGQVPKMAFRRTSRNKNHNLQISAASKAVTLGTTGMHTSRADEILEALMDLVAPERLGNPVALDFVSGIRWPFGRDIRPHSASLPGSMQLMFGTKS